MEVELSIILSVYSSPNNRPHYDKDDRSVERTPLHCKISKRWLYWKCPTPLIDVMLVIQFYKHEMSC